VWPSRGHLFGWRGERGETGVTPPHKGWPRTQKNPIWVGDLRAGEFFIFFEDYGRYSTFCVFAHAECALKNCLRLLRVC